MKSMIFGGFWNEADEPADEFASLHGSDWVPSESSVGSIISNPGTLRNLRIKLVAGDGTPISPGSGKHHTFILRKNGADTDLVVTISGDETEGSDLTHEVVVGFGTRINLKKVYHADIGAACYVRWVTEFEGSEPNRSLLFGSGGVQYHLDKFFSWTLGAGITEPSARQVCAVAGTIRNLYISLSQSPDPVGVDGYIFTLKRNGSNTALEVEITGDETEGHDASHSVSVSPGDIITIGQTRTETGNPARHASFWFGTSFAATTDGQVPLPFGGGGQLLNTTETKYSYLSHHVYWWGNTWEPRQYATACRLSNLYVQVSAAPGGGKSWTFTVMRNEVATDLVVVISGSAVSGLDSAHEILVGTGDELSLRCEPSGVPASAYAFGGLRSSWGAAGIQVTTDPASEISTRGATLNGYLNHDGGEDCDCSFEWGKTTAYGRTTPAAVRNIGESFAYSIAGLEPLTIYHFRAFAINSWTSDYGVDRAFVTVGTEPLPPPPIPPIPPPPEAYGVRDIITLEALRNLEMMGLGRIYIDEQGRLTYESRFHRSA